MIFAGGFERNYNLVIDSTMLNATGGTPLEAFERVVSLQFAQKGSIVKNENCVTHQRIYLNGVYVPSNLVLDAQKLYSNTALGYRRVSLPGTTNTLTLYDNFIALGQNARISDKGPYQPLTGTYRFGEIKTAMIGSQWCSVSALQISDHAANPKGRYMQIRLERYPTPAATAASIENKVRLNPTLGFFSLGVTGRYRLYESGSTQYYLADNGQVMDWGTGSTLRQTWTSMEEFLDAMLIRASTITSSDSHHGYAFSSMARPESTAEDYFAQLGYAFAATKVSSWFESAPLGVDVNWQKSAHSASYHISEMTQNAIDNCRYTDMNSLMYIADVVTFRQLLSSLAESSIRLLKARKIRTAAKAASNVYLASRYGVALTYRDTIALKDLVKDLSSKVQSPIHPRATRAAYSDFGVASSRYAPGVVGFVNYTARCKIIYDDPQNPLMQSIKDAMDRDIWPTLQNCWDWIPYSFVMDWITPISDILNNIDNMVYTQYLQVHGVVLSSKVDIRLMGADPSVSGSLYFGTVRLVDYERWVERTVRIPNVFAITSSTDFRNYAEATALVVQRL